MRRGLLCVLARAYAHARVFAYFRVNIRVTCDLRRGDWRYFGFLFLQFFRLINYAITMKRNRGNVTGSVSYFRVILSRVRDPIYETGALPLVHAEKN